MALMSVERAINTILAWLKAEEPIFNSIIDEFYQGKQITFFAGLRKVIPESSLPSIEVGQISDDVEWKYVRVQGDTFNLEVHLTISNKLPEFAQILEGRLATLITRILFNPIHVRGRIEGTNSWFFDAAPSTITYGAGGYAHNIRVTKIPWKGSIIVSIDDAEFPPDLQEHGDHYFN